MWTQKSKRYTYYSGELGPVTRVDIFYDLGGGNVWTGAVDRRGISVSIRALEIERSEGGGFRVERCTLFSGKGFRVFVLPLARFNQKTLDSVAAKLNPQEIVTLFEATPDGKLAGEYVRNVYPAK